MHRADDRKRLRFRRSRPRGSQPSRQPLFLEPLEERAVPTVVWSTAGSRNVIDLGGPVIPHADVDLIFWGAGWQDAPALMDQVTDAVGKIMASSYLSGLGQYRGVGNGQLLRTDLIAGTNPAARTSDGLFDAFVQARLNDGTLPVTPNQDSQIIYLVIPQPGTTVAGARGEHGQDLSNFGRFHYAWSENIGNLDDLTIVCSHELTETVTDPEPNFNTGFAILSTHDEICDGEAQSYTYRLDGVLVQSSLSQIDHAYEVYDGTSQRLVLSNTRALTITGDQLPDATDTITIDVVNGGYTIQFNNEFYAFDSGQVSSITINTLTGNDTVNIERTLDGRPVTINLGAGDDTVNLSPTAQNLATLGGTVTVNGGSGSGTLRLDDQASYTDQDYQLTNTTLTAPDMAPVSYRKLQHLELLTSNGTNTLTVLTTPPGLDVFVQGGRGSGTVIGSAVDNTWTLTSNDAGTLSSSLIAGLVQFAEMENLTGGAGHDTFTFGPGAALTGNLDGGAAGTLDYSASLTSVVVDLPLGSATGVGGRVSNVQNVLGGNGGGAGVYNVLVGDGGNTLTGGTGRRNLLIAGASASTLIGGDDEDLLIGGTTAYDMDLASLMAIMDYWSGSSDDYGMRVGNLLSGSGVALLDPTTIVSNGGGNTLLGGPGLNLYYGNAADASDFDPTSAAVFVTI